MSPEEAERLKGELGDGPPPTEQEQRDRTAQAYADQQAGKNPVDEQIKRDDAAAQAQAEAKAAADARAEAERRLNNHYQYGGYEGGARDAANFYAWTADAAENRKGEQINYYDAQGDRFNNGRARLGQESIAEAMRQRALGNAPTIAQLEADRQIGQANAAQTSIAASARGPAALALAQQQEAANVANADSTISNAAQINAAKERRDDEVAAFGAQTGLRQGDQAQQAADAQQAQAQAAINAQQRAQNDAYANANYGRSVDINRTQLDAQMHQIDTATGVATAAANRDAAKSMHDEDREDKWLALGGGLLATATGYGLSTLLPSGSGSANGSGHGGGDGSAVNTDPGAGGYQGNAPADGSLNPGTSGGSYGQGDYDPYKAKGGPVRMGRPYIVGEEGPELIIPKDDGHVLTADQTRDLGEIDEPRDMGEIDEPVRDLGDVDTPRMRGPNARDLGEIDSKRDPVSFERHNSPWMDKRILDMIAAQKAQNTMLAEGPSTAGAMARSSAPEDRHPLEQDYQVAPGDSPEMVREKVGRLRQTLNEPSQSNRVDAMLDNIHPLSYTYKDPSQEPRSTPTGGRYVGISAQHLEAVPEIGPQMVSDGPRGKQLEMGPTLSGAMAGIARLNERLRAVEGHPMLDRDASRLASEAEGVRAGQRAQLDAGPSAQPRSEVLASDIRAKSNVMSEGAYAPRSQLPGPQQPPTLASLYSPQPQLPGPQAPAALPGPQRQLPGPQRSIPQDPVRPQSPTLGSLYGQGTSNSYGQSYGGQRALPGPQRSPTLGAFYSDIRAKGDVQRESTMAPAAPATTGAVQLVPAESVRQPTSFQREQPAQPTLATTMAEGVGDTAAGFAAAPPVPGAAMSPTDVVKVVQAAGQATDTAARGYERMTPAMMMAKRRIEAGIDEAATRGANVYRAAVTPAPTLANMGGRR